MTKIKVLTLNAWGIALPWPITSLGSKDRLVRMGEIADALSKSDYDIVALQEVWSEDDYETIRSRVASALPDTFYFHSGMVGSGVCIFTRGTIYSTVMHRYTLNGYPHHIHRGDWFGGKVVGLARITLNGLKVDVYSTHLHAEYNKDKDLYLPHRVLQSYELSQFVTATTNGDLAIVMGDFNLEPTDFGYQLIVSGACLQDAHEVANNNTSHGGTCDVPTNCYTTNATLERWPNGKRLDFVLYRSNGRHKITASECTTTFGRIPSHPSLNYSDHEGVHACLDVTPVDPSKDTKAPRAACTDLLDKAIGLMDIGIAASASTRRMCIYALVGLLVVFTLTVPVEIVIERRPFTITMLLTRFYLTLGIGFFFVHGFIGMKMEQKALKSAKSGMLKLKRAYERRNE